MENHYREYSEEEKRQLLERYVGTAVHEAGHAVAAYVLGVDFESVTIDIDPETGAIGSVRTTPWPEELAKLDDNSPEVRKLQLANIVFSLAGGVAERRLASQAKWDWDVGDTPDVNEAITLASVYGDDDLESVMREAWDRTYDIIDENWLAVRALAWALVDKHRIEKKEAIEIIVGIQDQR